jgi:transcriptional regulator with XRE-family HTH domain
MMVEERIGARVGERVRKARVMRGLSQTELGFYAGITASGIQHLERGKSQPSIEVLARIALALGVSADWLLGISDEEPDWSEKVLAPRAGSREALRWIMRTSRVVESEPVPDEETPGPRSPAREAGGSRREGDPPPSSTRR